MFKTLHYETPSTDIVLNLTVRGLLLLGKVPDDVRPVLVHLAQDVEEERVHVEIQRLVVQEEFGQETEALAVKLKLLSVDFEDGEVSLPVDLLPGGRSVGAFGAVGSERE